MESPPNPGKWDSLDMVSPARGRSSGSSSGKGEGSGEEIFPRFADSPIFLEQENASSEGGSGGGEEEEPFPLTGVRSPQFEEISGGENAVTGDLVGMLLPGKNQMGTEPIKFPKKTQIPSKLPPLKPSSTLSSSSIQSKSPLNEKIRREIAKRSKPYVIEQQRKRDAERLEKEIQEKERKQAEAMQIRAEAKYQKSYEKYVRDQQKVSIILERKAIQENEFRLQAYSRLERQDQAEQRVVDQRAANEARLQEKAADRWLKQHFASQVSQQIERRKEAAARQRVRREEEKMIRVEEQREAKRRQELAERKAIDDAVYRMRHSSLT